jgi:hypothetical protein
MRMAEEGGSGFQGQGELLSEFEDRLSCIARPCLRNKQPTPSPKKHKQRRRGRRNDSRGSESLHGRILKY